MYRLRLLAVSTVFALGLGTFLAQAATPDTTVTYSVNGTLDPKIKGPDPAGAAGGSGAVTVTASTALKPVKHTTTSATYKIPRGAIVATVGGKTVKSNAPANLIYTIPATGPASMKVTGTFTYDGFTATISATVQLANGSFPKSVLTHPAAFSPTPQSLTAATTLKGAGSRASYTFAGTTTYLGLSGTASN